MSATGTDTQTQQGEAARTLADDLHHETKFISTDKLREAADRQGMRVEAQVNRVGLMGDWDFTKYEGVPGTFVSGTQLSTHVSTDMKQTESVIHRLDEARLDANGGYVPHDFVSLHEASLEIEAKEQDQLTLADLAGRAHKTPMPYDTDEIKDMAERGGHQIEAFAQWQDKSDRWANNERTRSVLDVKDIPGSFVTDGTHTMHISGDFHQAMNWFYDREIEETFFDSMNRLSNWREDRERNMEPHRQTEIQQYLDERRPERTRTREIER